MKLFNKILEFISWKQVVGNEDGILGLLAGLGGGALLGGIKDIIADAPRRRKQGRIRASEIRNSPFTGLRPTTEVDNTSGIGNILQFGGTGLSLASAIEQQAAQNALNEKILASLGKRGARQPNLNLNIGGGGSPFTPLRQNPLFGANDPRLAPGGF